MFRKIFGSHITFILWHSFIGGGIGFLMAAITNSVQWQELCRPIPTFCVLFIIGCFVGWFHHDKSKAAKTLLLFLIAASFLNTSCTTSKRIPSTSTYETYTGKGPVTGF